MASLYHLARDRMEKHRAEAVKFCVEAVSATTDQVRVQQGIAEGLRIALEDLDEANKDWDK